jgi:hypothetical protein
MVVLSRSQVCSGFTSVGHAHLLVWSKVYLVNYHYVVLHERHAFKGTSPLFVFIPFFPIQKIH